MIKESMEGVYIRMNIVYQVFAHVYIDDYWVITATTSWVQIHPKVCSHQTSVDGKRTSCYIKPNHAHTLICVVPKRKEKQKRTRNKAK